MTCVGKKPKKTKKLKSKLKEYSNCHEQTRMDRMN